MCDSFVALSPATANGTVILGKSADCQVNEALAWMHIPGRKHIAGEAIRATHLVIPQAEQTHEIFIGRSFWTYGAEIGFNEHGVAIGNEAVFTTLQEDEKSEGAVVTDMLRIGLERGKTAREAVEAIAAVLEQFGQGGNCELVREFALRRQLPYRRLLRSLDPGDRRERMGRQEAVRLDRLDLQRPFHPCRLGSLIPQAAPGLG